LPQLPGPRALRGAFESQIARGEGLTVARYRDRMNRTVLLATLERAVDEGVIDSFMACARGRSTNVKSP
jgi:hypothetical protein